MPAALRPALPLCSLICALCAVSVSPLHSARAAPDGDHLSGPDRKALESFKLTVDLLDRASAFHLNAVERLRKEPKARDAALLEPGPGGIGDSARRMEASPLLSAALKEARLSARDYLLISLSSITAAMVVALQSGGSRLGALPEGTSAANVAFLEKEGAAAFERFQKTGARLLAAGTPKKRGEAGEPEPAGEADPAPP